MENNPYNTPFNPVLRMRRLRINPFLRNMLTETDLRLRHLVQGAFVCPGSNVLQEIPSLPGLYRRSVDLLVEYAKELADLGVQGMLLFGLPEHKNSTGSQAWVGDGVIQQALRSLSDTNVPILKIADTCFCEYTDTGHCGPISRDANELVDNDRTLANIAKTAVSQARSGADVIAPSGMMDGTVAATRTALDAAGFQNIPILMYTSKFASAFYGPFREAACCEPRFGDRRSYQMNPANAREAQREAALDEIEGADILMVKPALSYLDVVARLRAATHLSVAAFNVSGEYAMVHAAAERGWLDGQRIAMEILTSIRRAGADLIVTYHAETLARERLLT